MTNQQLIDILQEYIFDLDREENERAARYIDLNHDNKQVRQERSAQQSAYTAALMAVNRKLTHLNRRIREEQTA